MGANRIQIEYVNQEPERLAFSLITKNGVESFMLPANVQGVLQAMSKDGVRPGLLTIGHARRVAWRIVKDWVAVQLAVIQAGLVKPDEVMLPYMVTADGQTLYQMITEQRVKLLPERSQDRAQG